MQTSELRIEVLEAFSALTNAISNLCDALRADSHLMAWVQDPDNPNTAMSSLLAREKACQIFSLLWYQANQAPREIILSPGFLGASAPTIKLAMCVNECKEKFKKSILAHKIAHTGLTEKMNSMMVRHYTSANLLSQAGLGRLHLKQCYRKIPILSFIPHKISWTWAHTRSIKKISIKKAQEMLLKKGNDIGIDLQVAKLNTIAPHESLAIVQELAPHLRANLVFKHQDQVKRQMIKGPIPILFPCEPNMPYPEFSPPSEKCEKDKNRCTRSDEKLDPNLFLPAIRAHRYR